MKSIEIGGIQRFDPNVNNVEFRWKKWLRGFELYAVRKGVTRADQKKALLVHSAGNEVQDIYFTLTETDPGENQNVCDVACKLLTDHFSPMTNVPCERSLFRSTGQQINETIEQFITRLREQAEYCNFGGGRMK